MFCEDIRRAFAPALHPRLFRPRSTTSGPTETSKPSELPEPSKPPEPSEPFRVFSCAANAAFRVRRGEEARRAGDGGLAPPDEVEARRQAQQRQADASRLFDTPPFVCRASAPPNPVNPVNPVSFYTSPATSTFI